MCDIWEKWAVCVEKSKTPQNSKCLWKTEVDSSMRIMKIWKAVKPIETASRSQSTETKIWKMTSGERSCST